MKICTKCNTERDESEFYTRKDGRNRTQCKSCELEYYQSHKDEVHIYNTSESRKSSRKDYIKNYNQQWRINNPEQNLFIGAKKRAKTKNLEFDIELADIVIPEYCPVLGIKLERNVGGKTASPNSPSLDRFDNSKGYVKGNIVVISYRANSIKNNSNIEELEKILNYMRGKNE